ncbi:MAG: hypothetical protein F4092_12495, partial [Rhodospirillaceae bacterium]|nr:hypothetical protein [Rhodospirillaceae bacterium]
MTAEAQREDRPAQPSGDSGAAAAPRTRKGGFFRALGRGILLLFKAAVPVAVLGGAFLAFQYMMATRPEVVRKPVAEKVYFVDTVTASNRTIVPRLVLYGNIVAGRQVDLL